MNEFTDPYAHLNREDIVNTSISVSKADQAYLMSLFSHRSVLQTTINILLSKFVQTLKKDLPYGYNPHRFRNAIATLEISCLIGGSGGTVANDGAATEREDKPIETADRDERQGTGGVVSTSQRLPAATLNPSGASQGRRGDKNKTESKKG